MLKNIFKCIVAILVVLLFTEINAQVNAVEFGKNRIQYKKFKWKFYQSPNFNTYVSQGGVELGNFVSQMAEEEIKSIETLEQSIQEFKNLKSLSLSLHFQKIIYGNCFRECITSRKAKMVASKTPNWSKIYRTSWFS